MAIYVFKMKTFSRNAGSRGSRATSAAAYRAGERIHDVRTGASYDHRRRHDVLHKEIVLPRALAARGREMDWARNRATLWNTAERAETRANARVAREFTLALPHELGQAERVQLAQRFANDLAERYRTAVDLVIHAPRGDTRNYHAHLLSTTRELTADGLGPKAALELSGTERHRRGLTRWPEERAWLRERWADVSNQALREAGLDVRVSPLPPRTPDLTRPPRLPLVAYHMEQAGRRSFIAERIRAQHRAQLEQAQLEQAQPERAQVERAQVERAQMPAGPVAASRRWLERARSRAQAVWHTVRDRLGSADAFDQSHQLPPVQRAAIPEPEGYAGAAGMSFPEDARQTALRDWLDYRQQAAAHVVGKTEPDRTHEQRLEQRLEHEHAVDVTAGAAGAGAESELPSGRGNDYDLSL